MRTEYCKLYSPPPPPGPPTERDERRPLASPTPSDALVKTQVGRAPRAISRNSKRRNITVYLQKPAPARFSTFSRPIRHSRTRRLVRLGRDGRGKACRVRRECVVKGGLRVP